MVDCCCCDPPPRRRNRRSIRPVAVPVVVPGDHRQMSDATMKEGHERRAVALPPPPRRRQAAAKLPPTSRFRAAATALPPPSCRRPRAVALPPPLPPPPLRRRSLVGCCFVVRSPILSSHAVMVPACHPSLFEPPPQRQTTKESSQGCWEDNTRPRFARADRSPS